MTRAVGEATEAAQLRALLEAQTRLRELAEAGYAEVSSILWRIGREALPEEMDEVLQSDPHLKGMPPKDLGDWIVEQLTAKHHRLRLLSRGDLGKRLEEAQRRAERAEKLAARLQRERDELSQQVQQAATLQSQLAASHAEAAQLRQQVETLRRKLLSQQEREAPMVSEREQEVPDWFAKWRESGKFDVDAALVRLLGDTGYCLRASLAAGLHQAGHLTSPDPSGGTAVRLFRRVKDAGLAEGFTPKMEAQGGRAPEILGLTERGSEAYRLLSGGQEPQESEYERLLARHKSPEHVLLNLQARDVLLAHGAQVVDLRPQPLQLPGGGTFDPDIVAIFDGKPIYVECERGGPKETKARRRKWTNYAAVTRDFYIVVSSGKVQSDVITEVNLWALDAGVRITLHICNLSKARKEGAELWSYERDVRWRR